jgi:hypothetical protein
MLWIRKVQLEGFGKFKIPLRWDEKFYKIERMFFPAQFLTRGNHLNKKKREGIFFQKKKPKRDVEKIVFT